MYLISQSILKQYGVLDIRFRRITMKHKKLDIWLYIVFAIYCAFLVWVILFKLQFSLKEIEQTRSINFIPFYNDGKGTVEFHISEAIDNLLILHHLVYCLQWWGAQSRCKQNSGLYRLWAFFLKQCSISYLLEGAILQISLPIRRGVFWALWYIFLFLEETLGLLRKQCGGNTDDIWAEW